MVLKSQEEISRLTGIPIEQLKSRAEIEAILARPPTRGIRVGGYESPVEVMRREEAVRKAQRDVARRIKEESARQEVARKARLEAAKQTRIAAMKQLRDEALKRKLFGRELKKFRSQEIKRLGAAQRREEELAGKTAREQLRILKEKVAKDLFIEEKVVDKVKKTVIVDERGNIVRDATPEERKWHKELEQQIKISEKDRLTRLSEKLEKGRKVSREELEKGRKLFRKQIEEFKRISPKTKKLSPAESKRLSSEIKASSQKVMRETFKLFATTAGQRGIDALIGVRGLGKLGLEIVKDPKKIEMLTGQEAREEMGRAIQEDVEETVQLLKVSPLEAAGKIATDIFIFKATSQGLKIVGKLTSKAATRLSPKFVGVKGHAIKIPSKQVGKKLTIKIGGTVKKLSTPLKKQVRLAGKEVTAVSAQADKLVRLIQKRRIVRKPIPGEKLLRKTTKKLLKKFDDGKINAKDLIRLHERIRKETKGAGSLLERSFFADPKGRLRPSRLGRQREASLVDILSGDVTFKTQKPQVLIFEKIKVEKFPKALKGIERKLKAGKTLTRTEANKLLQFQLKKSTKFKPVGAISKEPEITLAPGEIIKKGKTIAVTWIEGKRVPIVRATVVKAKPATQKLLKKASHGKLTASELKKLRSNLKKETGFKTAFSRGRISKARIPARRMALTASLRVPKRVPKRPPRRVPRRPPKKIPKRPPRKPPKKIPRKPPKRKVVRRPPVKPPKRPPRRVPRRPPRKPPKKPVIIKKVKKKIRKPPIKPKVIQGYNVYGKYKRKFIRLNKIPLSKKDALHRGAFAIDKSTANTFKIEGVGKVKKLGKLTKGEKGHFPKTRKKYRSYKIRKGRRITLKDKFIEKKGKPRIDTRGEIKGLSLAKFAKQKGFIGKRTSMMKRKHSTSRKPVRRSSKRKVRKRIQMRVPTRSKIRKPSIPLKLKRFKKELIKKAPRGKKPTRYRFKGNQRLGFRNNKVVEIVKFTPRKKSITSTQSNYNQRLRKSIKRKATPQQLRNLKKGREKLARMRRGG